jgi:uncharacterized protein (TIGR00255 family)
VEPATPLSRGEARIDMIKSMTGFANQTHEDERGTIAVTVRSVNHRYLDLQLRVPLSLNAMESKLRAVVQQHVARGRVEVAVTVQLRQEPTVTVELNQSLVTAVGVAIDRAREAGIVQGALTPGDLLRFPQAFAVREQPVDLDEAGVKALADAVERAVTATLVDLDGMRNREGTMLRTDLDARQAAVSAMVEGIATRASDGEAELVARLTQRVDELSMDPAVDKALIAQEVVRFAARSDISEEVVRFRAHAAQWATLSDSPEPCGRKLDFLLQEMNREVNTMGSKADGATVSELIVSAKAELEKMREQVQNVE